MKIFIKTFGCRTNIYDSEQILSHLKAANFSTQNPAASTQNPAAENARFSFSQSAANADVVVINGCTVTNSADASTAAYVRQIRRQNPDAKIILTGCAAASAAGKELFKSGAVDGILGAAHKAEAASLLARAAVGEKIFAQGDRKFIEKPTLQSFAQHTKAFVKIQEGCDFACSYCIIPAVRGHSRSLNEAEILRQCRELIAAGHSELVLTGTNMGSYGKDRGGSLAALLGRIGALPGLRRLRLGSLESAQIDEAFLELLGESWLERHLHIALQHTHPQMLALMRRRNKALEDLALFEQLAAAGYALGSDFIVAHPGETEAIWREAMSNFARYPLTHLHAFIYSKRAGTHSVRLCEELGVPSAEVAKERLHEITARVKAANERFCAHHAASATPLLVLAEQRKNGFWQGYDQFYNLVKIPDDGNISRGQWLQIKRFRASSEGNLAEIFTPAAEIFTPDFTPAAENPAAL